MIVSGERFLNQILEAIKYDACVSEEKFVLILVANGEVDALAAGVMVQDILRKENCWCCLQTVENYDDVQAACARHFSDTQDVRTCIMIQCGATEDVRWRCQLSQEVRLVIIDSHRPVWHGYNDEEDNANVVVVDDDDPVCPTDVPEYNPDDERRAHGDASSSDDEDEEEEEEEEAGTRGGDGAGSQERPALGERPRKRRKGGPDPEFEKRREKVLDYYTNKSGYGKPSALIVYQLAHMKQLESPFNLWLGILGLTEQLLLQRMDKLDYDRWRLKAEDYSRALNALDDGEDLPADMLYHHQLTVLPNQDLRLTMYRDWALLEALLYTPYVAARLQTWRDKGVEQVKLMLAKMGIASNQYEGHYTQMRPHFKNKLVDNLKTHCSKFYLNYDLLKLDSFELQYKADLRLTAAEHVLALSALLAQPRRAVEGHQATDAYHLAYCALHCYRSENLPRLKMGMERAKALAKAIVTEGGLQITRHQVTGGRTSSYWLLNMADLEFGHKEEFQHPLVLQRLGIFLRDAMTNKTQQRGEAPRPKPMVVVGSPDENDDCHVVALRAAHKAGQMQSNPFARPFEDAVENLGGDIRVSISFDRTIYCMPRRAVPAFLEELKTVVALYNQQGAQAAAAALAGQA